DFKFTKKDRDDLWNKIDASFKKLKEKRGGNSGQQNNELARTEARYNGLIGAIQKMQRSIDFDQKDLDYEAKRVANSDGQLESQLRQAKINMIAERIKSKQEKIDDMHKTKTELESKIEREKRRAVKVEKQVKIDEAKELVKQKIASEISENAKELDKMSDKLEKAAGELVKKPKPKKDTFLDKLTDSIENLVEDVVDTAKSVSEVVGDKVDEMVGKAKSVTEVVGDKMDDVMDKAEEVIDEIRDRIENKEEKLKDKKKKKEDDVKKKEEE
ncbi:MAG: hypothetical protein H7X99_09995, partial [Saprospiraceae bacterium]|nr:hypothetical protein [Saprospiraceae bacterium]